MNHTPGPWKVRANHEFAHVGGKDIYAGNFSVALCDEENASLIAAAPSLLSAAKTALFELDYLLNGVLHDAEDIKQAANMLRNAIKEATP